jgi:transcriptional regulator with XRE-family HTH domain
MTTIHTRIKQRREALGISMKALADMVGVSAWQTIQQWEREDGTAPKRDRLEAVARALQTTPEALLFGGRESELESNGEMNLKGISVEALSVARAFDRLRTEEERTSVLTLLKAFGAL